MIAGEISAGELRYHLQELSVSVARQLVAVLDKGAMAPAGVAAELDAVVAEITDIQRDLAYEMAGPPFGGAPDFRSLARMLELQSRTNRLMDRLEALTARGGAGKAAQIGWTALKDEGRIVEGRGGTRTAYDEELLEALRWSEGEAEPPGQPAAARWPTASDVLDGTASSQAMHGGWRWSHLSPAARFSVLPVVLCAVSALVTTVATRLMTEPPTAGIVRPMEEVAKRSDRLDHADAPMEQSTLAGAPIETGALSASDRYPTTRNPEQTALVIHPPASPTLERDTEAPNAPDASAVAVIGTHQDPDLARRSFAELRRRYPAILGGAEAELDTIQTQDGATWHRVAIVPPLPRTEAKDLCRRLRAAGHPACWVNSRERSAE